MIRALGCNGADAYSVATGAQLWKVKSDCSGGGGLPVVSGGRLYALNNYPFWDVQPWIFDTGNGNVLGHFNANRSPAFENNIGVFSYNGIVQAEDMLTGAPLWSFTGDCSLTAPPIMVHGYAYLFSGNGNLYAVNERTGQLAWSANVGAAGTQTNLAAGQGLLVVPAWHRLVVYGSAGSSPPSGPPAPVSPAGHQAFTTFSLGSTIVDDIASGADGNLWFVERAANRIGRITPAGTVAEFPIPSPQSDPRGIIRGPDGAIWFAEQAAGNLGRITADGTITEFPLAPPWATRLQPYKLTIGPDQALWGTLPNNTAIFRMTTEGIVTVFAIPAYRYLGGITTGPDGNLWFAASQFIGRMSTTGAYAEWPLPYSSWDHDQARAENIISGPDGNLWFTEPGYNIQDFQHCSDPEFPESGFGRITTSGVITAFHTPETNTAPLGITVGADNNLWITDHHSGLYGSQLVRVTAAGDARNVWMPGQQYLSAAFT